jgi:hypothetical protein
MFRIRKILDDASRANSGTMRQMREILTEQFPLAGKKELEKLSSQLNDPMKYQYRSILFVVENSLAKVKAFAYLEFISSAGTLLRMRHRRRRSTRATKTSTVS